MERRDYGRHYVVVVHGIGDQRLNETTSPVIHRFAEQRARLRTGQRVDYRYVVPSNLSSQSVRGGGIGHGWSEFKGIPLDPSDHSEAFDGTAADSGENFRFIDLLWADILRKDQAHFAVPVEQWAPAVLARIDRDTGVMPDDWVPAWANRMLEAITDAGISLKRALALRYPELAKTIFDDFLGDVHLYGDYARTRGWAVRHFHTVLDEICLRDFFDWASPRMRRGQPLDGYRRPRFTVIAHSLGSIMAFDALTYAFTHPERVRSRDQQAEPPCPSLPFSGYTFAPDSEGVMWGELRRNWETLTNLKGHDGKPVDGVTEALLDAYPELAPDGQRHAPDFARPPHQPHCLWREGVRNFITLGSPIDKYHVLWTPSYRHLGLRRRDGDDLYPTTPFKEEWFAPPRTPIVHYNLCDEQDPVGHHLDVAGATRAYPLIFDASIPVGLRDVVFRRYPIPGKAHVDYWNDKELFHGIVGEVIDERPVEVDEVKRKRRASARRHVDTGEPLPEGRGYFLSQAFNADEDKIYRQALSWSYAKIPFIAALITALLAAYGLDGLFDPEDDMELTIDRVLAVVGAVLLWVRPAFLRGYSKGVGKGAQEKWRIRNFFARGLLALLIEMAVEWRLIVVQLNRAAGCASDHGRTEPCATPRPPPALLTFTAVMAVAAAAFITFNVVIDALNLPLQLFRDALHPVWQSPPVALAAALAASVVFGWDRLAARAAKRALREREGGGDGPRRRSLSSHGRLVVQMYLRRPLAPIAALTAALAWDALCATPAPVGWVAWLTEVVLFTAVTYLWALLYALYHFDRTGRRLARE